MANILVVEDDWEMNQGICYMLEKEGLHTVAAHSVEEAKGHYKNIVLDMILLDVNLPNRAGLHGTVGAFECKRTAFAVAHPADLGQLHAAVDIIDMFRFELRNAKAISDVF